MQFISASLRVSGRVAVILFALVVCPSVGCPQPHTELYIRQAAPRPQIPAETTGTVTSTPSKSGSREKPLQVKKAVIKLSECTSSTHVLPSGELVTRYTFGDPPPL